MTQIVNPSRKKPFYIAPPVAAAWGAITGTLSNQTDLQTALNGKQASGSYATGTGTANGTNTGDNATNTQYSGLAASKQDTLVSATNIKTINGSTILGSGDLTVSVTQPEIPVTRLAPVASQTITAGYSAYVCGPYEIVTATSLEIGAGACFEIG